MAKWVRDNNGNRTSKGDMGMKDFWDWLNSDAPEWAVSVAGTLIILAGLIAASAAIWLTVAALLHGYWIIIFVPPAVAIWVIFTRIRQIKGTQIMTLNCDIFGPKKGFLNHIKWALTCVKEDVRFWAEMRLTKLLRWLEPDDGRPCNTDVFLATLFDEVADHYACHEAIEAWLEGDWADACEGLSIELKETKP